MANTGGRREPSAGAFAAGMILGAFVGFALWIATATFVFFPYSSGRGWSSV